MNKERKAAYYQTDVGSVLEFSWKGFKVNGTEMVKVKSDGEFPLDFNTFTFISPILDSHCSEILQKVYFNSPDLANVNYGYIVGIVTIVALIFDSKSKMMQILRQLFRKVDQDDREAEYETTDRLESTI